MKIGTIVYFVLLIHFCFIIFMQDWSAWLNFVILIPGMLILEKLSKSNSYLQKKIHFLAGCGVLYGVLIMSAFVLEYVFN